MSAADDVRTIRVAVAGLIPGDVLVPTGQLVLSRPERRLALPAAKRAVRLKRPNGSIRCGVWNARTIVTVRRDPLDAAQHR